MKKKIKLRDMTEEQFGQWEKDKCPSTKVAIVKCKCANVESCFISIRLKNEYIDLPYFKPGEIYEGMENDRSYTLEDLGL